MGCHAVQPLAGREQRIDVAIDVQVEMRDGLLRQGEPLGEEAAHAVVGHDLVGAGLVEREDLLVGEAAKRGQWRCLDHLAPARRFFCHDLGRLGFNGWAALPAARAPHRP